MYSATVGQHVIKTDPTVRKIFASSLQPLDRNSAFGFCASYVRSGCQGALPVSEVHILPLPLRLGRADQFCVRHVVLLVHWP